MFSRVTVIFTGVAALACGGTPGGPPLLSREVTDPIAWRLAELGHPEAEYQWHSVVWDADPPGAQRRFDMEIHYKAKHTAESVMTVRVVVHATSPCRLTATLQSDDGRFDPNPIPFDSLGPGACTGNP